MSISTLESSRPLADEPDGVRSVFLWGAELSARSERVALAVELPTDWEERQMRKRTLAFVAFGASAMLAIGAAFAMAGSSKDVEADLSGLKEVPANSTTGNGSFEAEGRSPTRSTTASNTAISKAATVLFAHIHLGRPATNGGVAAFLCGGDTPACPQSGTVEGTITADDVADLAAKGSRPASSAELVRAIRRNATYVNVHTEAFPGGEIRGT